MSDGGTPRRHRRTFAPLGHRDFALYLGGWACSRFGRSVEETALLWAVYDLTHSAAMLGLLGLARAVPSIALGAVAGGIADRYDQRHVLFATQTLGAAASTTAAVLIGTGQIEVWHLYALVVFEASVDSFDGGARQAMYPRLVPVALLPEAVTLNQAAGRVMQLLGPATGGFLIAGYGITVPFVVNALSFPVLMLAVALIRTRQHTRDRGESTLVADLRAGLAHVAAMPAVRGLLLLEIAVNLFQVNPVIITVLAVEVLGAGPRGLGILLSAPAIGSVIALAGMLMWGQGSRQGRLVIVCTLTYAGALLVLGLVHWYVIALTVLAAIGILDSLMTVTRHSIIQIATPDTMRGRVMGLMGTITRGVSPVGQLQSGAVASVVGASAAVGIAGVMLAVAAARTARNRALWLFRTPSSEAAEAASPPAESAESPPAASTSEH